MKNLKFIIPMLFTSLASFGGEDIGSIGNVEKEREVILEPTVLMDSYLYGLQFQFSALFLQPTSNSLNYAAQAVPLPLPSPHWDIFEIHPHYHFGFDLAFRGYCHTTNTNVAVNWEHFHSDHSASKKVSSQNMIGPFFEIGPDAHPYKKAHGTADFHFDEINIDFGQLVDFSECLQTNLFAGVSIARIKQNLCSKFSNDKGTIVRSINVPSRFFGAGPQVGLDFNYQLLEGLQFAGRAAAAILVGTLKNHTSFKALSPALQKLDITPPNKQSTCVEDKIQVVPSLEEKLGLSYCFTMCDTFLVNIEAGYQAQVYFNAIQSVDIGSEVVTPPLIPDTVGVFARTFRKTLSNFALTGPYVSIGIEY